ncbi:hypothetical protein GCK72_007382 [Caenorhabditis remanei]|uniref:BTB domain-containing protein n=1 Tax=Caenorhabditis remanei TaxID=31234 RepID=A0A6A5HM24_CAERE|nr:hypothetical protein GCK72_007382 [Caenorhabditis remanei]KAF1767423.1 hypothetical protein GCK72_007382 [Caenorhabditis remanei]
MSTDKVFQMKHVFTDLLNMEKDKFHYLPTEIHFKIPWKLGVYVDGSYAQFFLHCEKFHEIEEWSIDTNIVMNIRKIFGENDSISIDRIFSQDIGSNSRIKFFSLGEMDSYLINGNVTIEFNVTINGMKGIKESFRTFNESEFSDVVLIAGDQKFHVIKMYLAAHSTYFNTLFHENFKESGNPEIELKDVDPYELQHFLEVLYGESSIDNDTVTGILKLGDMYDARTAIRRCEEFLLEKSKHPLKMKFVSAVRYNMDRLKEKCLSEMNTVAEIVDVVPEDADQFSPTVWKELFLKAYSSH